VQDGVYGQVFEVGLGSGSEGCLSHRTWLYVSHGSQFLVRKARSATFSLTPNALRSGIGGSQPDCIHRNVQR
jgi:hypothetical protein